MQSPQQLTVSFEENSRIQLCNGKTVWNEGDLVSVFYLSNGNEEWAFEGATGDRTGTLKKVRPAKGSKATSEVVVVYPYNPDYCLLSKILNVEAQLPAEQTYAENSYGIGSSIMIAASKEDNFSLKNTCGWLDLQLCNKSEFIVEKIVLKGGNNEQLAGDVLIDSHTAEVTLATQGAVLEDDNSVGGTLIIEDSIFRELTLVCPDGVKLQADQPTHFYFALPPQTFTKGFTAEIYFTNGMTDVKSTSREIVIERNTIQPMSQIAVDINNVPNNTIYYTTVNNEILPQIRNLDQFGAELVSHTYENGLGTITFNGDITTIGQVAFNNGGLLKSIYLPDCISVINPAAFAYNRELTEIKLPKSLQNIGYNAFEHTGLKDITLPEGLTVIESGAFSYTPISSIQIPQSVETFNSNAFVGCENLAKFTGKFASTDGRFLINDSQKLIGFAPYGISEVVIPQSAFSISAYIFYGCSNITKIELPNTLQQIYGNAFSGCSISEITIPQSVTYITAGTFEDCPNLTTFKGKFATDDGRCLINNAGVLVAAATVGLTEFAVPDGVTHIYITLGREESTIEHLTIPASVQQISGALIQNNSNLKTVTINGCPEIYPYTFSNCPNLTAIYLPNAVTPPAAYIYSGDQYWNAFVDCPNLKIYVPTSAVSSYKAATGWSDYADIIFSDGSPAIETLDASYITDVTPGIGFAWIKFTKVPYGTKYQIYSGDTELEYSIYTEDNTYIHAHVSNLELNATMPIKIKVSNPDIENASFSDEITMTVGNIYQLTDNVGPTTLSVGWTDIIQGGTNTDRAYAVQLATDEQMTNLVYDIYCRDGQGSVVTSYGVSSWYGKKNGSNISVPTAVAFGQLSPNTTYYFRVKTVGYTYTNKVEMEFPLGESDFSPVVSFTTEAAHTPTANEVLYQGFDDVTLQTDHINYASGTTPLMANKKETVFPHQGVTEEYWCVYPATTSHKLSTWGISVATPFIDGSTTLFGKENFVAGDKIPSLTGWNHADEVHPHQGYLKVGTSGTKEQYLATPAIYSDLLSADGTPCTLSFKASTVMADTGVASIYQFHDGAWNKVGEVVLPRACASYTDSNNYVYDGKWLDFSIDVTIAPGDVIAFTTSNKLRFVIDDILITTK